MQRGAAQRRASQRSAPAAAAESHRSFSLVPSRPGGDGAHPAAAPGRNSAALPDAVCLLRQALNDASVGQASRSARELRATVATLSDAARQMLACVENELSTAGDGLLFGLWESSTYRHLTIHPRRHMVEHHGRRHSLTRTEWLLLDALLTHPGVVLSKRRLADLAWGTMHVDRSQEVEVYISRLRRKVEKDPPKPSLIKTVRGEGYVLTPE